MMCEDEQDRLFLAVAAQGVALDRLAESVDRLSQAIKGSGLVREELDELAVAEAPTSSSRSTVEGPTDRAGEADSSRPAALSDHGRGPAAEEASA